MKKLVKTTLMILSMAIFTSCASYQGVHEGPEKFLRYRELREVGPARVRGL